MIALPFADPDAYVARYAEPDEGDGPRRGRRRLADAYWTSTPRWRSLTLLLAADGAGLGSLLFGVFRGEAGVT
ncbi:MAG: hypothetical protein R2697_05330 [Ilumatobacteraceae bacterium]